MLLVNKKKKIVFKKHLFNCFLEKENVSEEQFFIASFFIVQKLAENQETILMGIKDDAFELNVPLKMSALDFIQRITIDNNHKTIEFFLKESDETVWENSNLKLVIEKEEESNFKVSYLYNEHIYSSEQIEILNLHYETVMADVLENKNKLIAEVAIVSSYEKDILVQVNETDREYSDNLCIHERVTQTAKMYPNHVALEYQDSTLTYQELEEKSNQIANYLVSQGIGKGDFIGILLPRGIEMIIAMLGVMKSGAAYIPLLASLPMTSLTYILENCQAKGMLVSNALELDTKFSQINLNEIDFEKVSSDKLVRRTTPDSVAAVIYTSGTTGAPKGVMIRHNTVVNYCEYNLVEMVLPVGSRVLQFAPFMFSTMIYEVITTLFSGSHLHLVEDEIVKDIRQFQMYILKHPINFLLLPSQYVDFIQIPDTINIIETGASDCQVKTSDKINDQVTHMHAYGLTEGSIVAVWRRKKELPNNSLKKIPIGKPVYNTKAYVLSDSEQPQGMYMPGELCVTGVAVSDGYLNLPELTAKRFVDNPFGPGKMLRTGDIVQWNYNGELEYLGRADNQVEIRGMRVELEEIEYQLSKNEAVISSAVIMKEDEFGGNFLAAFVVGKESIDIERLRTELSLNMLDYMVPSFIKQIPQMPYTPNGKIDKKTLAEIPLESVKEFVEAKTPTEMTVVKMFKDILSVEKVSITDSFFEIGGHSLTASKLLNFIEEKCSIKLSFANVFELRTAEKIAEKIDKSQKVEIKAIDKVPQAKFYSMSPAQKRMFFISELEGQNNMYHLPYIVKIKGRLDNQKITKVFKQLVNRHEIMRTSFAMRGNEPVQVVNEELRIEVPHYELPEMSLEELSPELLNSYFHKFDIYQAPLIALTQIDVADNNSLLLVNMHHIISDGMSLTILVKEISDLYNDRFLNPLDLDYKDYSAWVNKQDYSKESAYWHNEFSETVTPLDFPLDFLRPSVQSYNGNALRTTISETTRNQILRLAKETETTEYMIFLTTLMIVLSKYSRQEDIIIGSPISGRFHRDTEDMFGLFINSLAMRGNPSKDKSVSEFLTEIRETCLNAYENQAYPFELLVDSLDISRDLSRHPLFDVMLVIQNNEKVELELEGLEAEVITPESTNAQYDLTFEITEKNQGYSLEINYCSDLFKEETIDYLEKHFQFVLSQVLAETSTLIKDIKTVTEEESSLISGTFNQTNEEYDDTVFTFMQFEEQVRQNPNKEILVFEDQVLTYGELNERANRVAHYLRQLGVKPNDFVALYTKRSVEMYVGVFGILKAGAAYVPINVNHPKKQVDFILNDLKPLVALTYGTTLNSKDVANIIDLSTFDFTEYSEENPIHINHKNDAIYGIYTSGTTGRPKCVVIEHRNMMNYCQSYATLVKVSQLDNPSLLSISEYSFDIFSTDCLFAVANGIKVFLANEEEEQEPSSFLKLLARSKAKLLQSTPAKFKLLTSDKAAKKSLSHLEYLIVGGEVLTVDFVDYARGISKTNIINAYGPSEATVLATDNEVIEKETTIGKPIANCQVYIQSDNQLVGIGIPGEIVIAGDGVGRGYYGLPELTTEKFVPNQYGDGKMYLTGDLGRWSSTGEIEFLGRIDSQAKIRGYRIELDGITSVILKQKNILDAVVVKKLSNGEEAIHAYLVADEFISIHDLKETLSAELPNYMVPPFILQIDQLPLTTNGKIAEAELPAIDPIEENKVLPLKNETQEKVARIFRKVLGVESIGSNSHFFELGGHSLLLTSVTNQIEEVFNKKVKLQEVYMNPTVEEISMIITDLEVISSEKIQKAVKQPFYTMSPAQQRLFVLDQMEDVNMAYNMPSLLKMAGGVDRDKLQRSLDCLVCRHDILRTSFEIRDDNPVQIIQEKATLPVTVLSNISVKNEAEELELLNHFVRPFDLSQAPLMRVELIETVENDTYLMIDTHHIISDGKSIHVLFEELLASYQGEEQIEIKQAIQYKDYSEWLKKQEFSIHEAYWAKELATIPVLELPLDYPRPVSQNFEGATLKMVLDDFHRNQVEELARISETTPYMVLVATFMLLLSRQSLQEDIILGSPVSGRTHYQIENVLGMFVNNIVLKGNLDSNKTYLELLKEVKKSILNALEHQALPYENMVELAGMTDYSNRNPLFDVMFVYQNDETFDNYLEEFNVSKMLTHDSIAKFDLSFTLAEKNSGYEAAINFSTQLFKKETIQYMLEHFKELLSQVVSSPDNKLSEYSVVSEAEKEEILTVYNTAPSEADYLSENVNELLLSTVAQYGFKTAICFKDTCLTYNEFNQQVTAVAVNLLNKGLEKGDFVGLVCHRSVEMIAMMFGIMRAGGIYIPIDPDAPTERVKVVLSDAKPSFIVTDVEDFSGQGIEILKTSELLKEVKDNDLVVFPKLSIDDLAYVLFTSGTTGVPKGVLVKHGGLINLQYYFRNSLGVTSEDHILQFADYTFDASIWEITMALLNGGTLHLIDEGRVQEIEELANYITENISIVTLPPQYVLQLPIEKLELKLLVTAGSQAVKEIIENKGEQTRFVNAYGPSETTVCATAWEYDSSFDLSENIPIGKGISHSQVYVLNDNLLSGVGMPGELCVAGRNLSAGYLNLDNQTKENFIDNPFGQGKLYKTGDLARFRADGQLEYLGRKDRQVKLRGFRIELSEVEAVLRNIQKISDAAVIVRKNAQQTQELLAYVIMEPNTVFDKSMIEAELIKQLPSYMIPVRMTAINALPLNTSGKLVESELPNIEIEKKATFEMAQNKTEETLVSIFSDVLGITNVSTTDDFFELGGDSIKAIRVVSKLRNFGYDMTVKEILQNRTIQKIANLAVELGEEVKYEQGIVTGKAPLTPIQENFFASHYESPEHFNQAMLLETDNQVDQRMLYKTLEHLMKHHDGLRSVFKGEGQWIRDEKDLEESFQMDIHYIEDSTDEEQLQKYIIENNNSVQKTIDLSEGPLVKCVFYQHERQGFLLICAHHLVIDAVSWRIFLEDFVTIYNQLLLEKSVELPMKTASIIDWSNGMLEYAKSKELKQEVSYWKSVLKRTKGVVWQNHIEHENSVVEYDRISKTLSQDVTASLLNEANKSFNTELTDLLLTALGQTFYKENNMTTIDIQLEGHGREAVGKETSLEVDRTVGWFTSVYPVVINASDNTEDNIIGVKEMLRGVPNNGFGLNIIKYKTNYELPDYQPTIGFNYLGKLEQLDSGNGHFKLAKLSAGRTIAANNNLGVSILITAQMEGDRLMVDFTFDKYLYSQTQIEKYLSVFEEELLSIINFCLAKEEEVVTLSDLGVTDFEKGDLDILADLLNDL